MEKHSKIILATFILLLCLAFGLDRRFDRIERTQSEIMEKLNEEVCESLGAYKVLDENGKTICENRGAK